jgi:alpha-N-arabinofuranosidase
VSASFDAESQQGAVFLVNRSLTEAVVTEINWQNEKTVTIDQAWQLAGDDPKTVNTWDNPDRLVANTIPVPAIEKGQATLRLPPLSFTALRTSTGN